MALTPKRATAKRPSYREALTTLQFLEANKEELEKFSSPKINQKVREGTGLELSTITVRKLCIEAGYVKPRAEPRPKSDKTVARVGRIEVVLAELLVALQKDGMPCAASLIAKFGLRPQ